MIPDIEQKIAGAPPQYFACSGHLYRCGALDRRTGYVARSVSEASCDTYYGGAIYLT